ncbi:DUF4442 domain-containing protein [Hyunsoonleella aestuarii]|uniref:DUF4442 domain-containing protein n=1 Tax=Hyunsoonleella aestuarii TaxID=912802 RepID=A0ABP8ECL1_9FLAO|nr:DUF4442 domain-containing protein [Hyunsoonleella aestuarii]
MDMTPMKINVFNIFKLPSAYLCGVRAKYLDDNRCVVSVKHRWINQNPFKSMYWVVQGMAAELSTGALVMNKINQCNEKISMLVASNNSTFTKKATGRIKFICKDGAIIDKAIENTIKTKEGQTFWMQAIGTNSDDVEVSTFNFEWTIKLKS